LDEDMEGTLGNPNLKPFRATNFDASVEYYFRPDAVVQAGIFMKDVKNFIVDATFKKGTYNGIAYEEVTQAINGDTAEIRGFEFAYAQAYTFLPAPFDGLLASVNYTFTDTEGKVNGRTIALPTSAKNTYNLVLGYEKGPLSLRAAAAYRSGYLDELGAKPEEDRYVKDHTQIDLSAKYRVTKNLRVFAELVNANDATYTAYQKGPKGDRLLQYEEYSWTGKLGIKFNY
ncbi:MAG: TonB-dependent receptor domain-containing protein, partial [Asticcacaulis sp.]